MKKILSIAVLTALMCSCGQSEYDKKAKAFVDDSQRSTDSINKYYKFIEDQKALGISEEGAKKLYETDQKILNEDPMSKLAKEMKGK